MQVAFGAVIIAADVPHPRGGCVMGREISVGWSWGVSQEAGAEEGCLCVCVCVGGGGCLNRPSGWLSSAHPSTWESRRTGLGVIGPN